MTTKARTDKAGPAATKMNTAQRNQLITNAILEAITSGKGEWITGIVPAVTALNVTKSNDGLKVRACLQTLIDKGLVYRVSFTSDEIYDLIENKVVQVAPAGGFTIQNAFENGDFIEAISAAHCAAYEDEKMPESVTCNVTGITVYLKVEKGQFVETLEDGTDVSELFNRALDKAVGMG
ncbi:hypothetical protein [Pseudomonas sp. P9(2020)]|uniref:hypothetical protein n=1 Tax=Pseudomonas sp. P9(2020) TaxID=2763316 RepID=UPI001B3368BE|nr:hypothetical protein [Pseudomonas sp. P9(2020)]MBP5947944.1 hypothetical protein [Pseudomonas sp. P9(2020)]